MGDKVDWRPSAPLARASSRVSSPYHYRLHACLVWHGCPRWRGRGSFRSWRSPDQCGGRGHRPRRLLGKSWGSLLGCRKIWRPVGVSNPCFRRERAKAIRGSMLWPWWRPGGDPRPPWTVVCLAALKIYVRNQNVGWLRGHATSVVCTLTMRSFRPFLAMKFKAP